MMWGYYMIEPRMLLPLSIYNKISIFSWVPCSQIDAICSLCCIYFFHMVCCSQLGSWVFEPRCANHKLNGFLCDWMLIFRNYLVLRLLSKLFSGLLMQSYSKRIFECSQRKWFIIGRIFQSIGGGNREKRGKYSGQFMALSAIGNLFD